MERVSIKSGDMLLDNSNNRTYVAVTDTFTKRYMDTKDYEMESHGMGHLAGTYESAVKVVDTETGRSVTLRLARVRYRWTNLTAKNEDQQTETRVEGGE